MKKNKTGVFGFIIGLISLMLSPLASATTLIPAGTLTTLGTDLTDTFTDGIGWAYPIMLTFTGGVIAFTLVRRLIKMGARA